MADPVPVVPDLLRAKVRVFAELHRKTRELERLNSELEQRVADRTAALEASTAALQQLNDELEVRIEQRTREREQALAQLFEAQKIDTIGHLTGGVAHDFNNLLTVINGYCSMALMKKEEVQPIRKNVEEILKASERAASLTNQLLAFSRKQVLQPRVLQLNEVMRSMDKSES